MSTAIRAFYCPHCKGELVFSVKIALLTSVPGEDWREIPLEAMAIPVRAKNALKNDDYSGARGLETAGAIDAKSDRELMSFPNMGWKTVRQVRAEIERLKKGESHDFALD